MILKSVLLTICLFLVRISIAQSPITVYESTFKLSGVSEEVLYYGFADGDELLFEFEELKGKALKEVEILEYPSSSQFMDFKTSKVSKSIKVNSKGIYMFRFSNSALNSRICKIKIQRIPSSNETVGFDSDVVWRTITDTTFYTEQENYLISQTIEPKTVVPRSEYYINSGSNAIFKGGKSRIVVPVTLPPNTKEWYYVFSASRNKEDIASINNTLDLAGELSTLIDQTGILNIGIDMLTQPPGANICDIYLLDFNNSRSFEAKEAFKHHSVGSRENFKSGIVKLNIGNNETVYLGIKNPDNMYGIHVAIEVVAITIQEEWGVRDIKKYTLSERKEPYLN